MLKGTLALLAFAQFGDVFTTWYDLAHGAHEGNPIALLAVGFGGWAFVVVLKIATVPFVGVIANLLPATWRKPWLRGVRVASLMLLGVVASNVLVAL